MSKSIKVGSRVQLVKSIKMQNGVDDLPIGTEIIITSCDKLIEGDVVGSGTRVTAVSYDDVQLCAD